MIYRQSSQKILIVFLVKNCNAFFFGLAPSEWVWWSCSVWFLDHFTVVYYILTHVSVFDLFSEIGHRTSSPEFSYEDRLIKHLLRRYEERGKYGRPVSNYSDIVELRFGLQLIQIMNLDERKQILTLNVWTSYVSNSCHSHVVF